jgi:predicted nucleotidyltransferase
LLVELPGERTTGAELLTVLALTDELSSALGARVDVVTPRTLRDDVRDAAVAEAVPL